MKQFSGASIDEVLTKVRAELGDEAVILQTKRVVTGGIGGFFGREGVEVTAAEGMPHEEEAANREAAASVATAPEVELPAPSGAPAGDDAEDEAFVPSPFRRHLDGRLAAAQEAEAPLRELPYPAAPPASPAAAYARAGSAPAPAAPFAPGGVERAQAIMEAARAAVREAHEQAVAAPVSFEDPPALHAVPAPAPIAPAPIAPAPVAPVPVALAPVAPAPVEMAPPPAVGAFEVPRTTSPRPRTPASAGLDGVRFELARAGVDDRFLDPFLDGFETSVVPFLDGAPIRDAVRDHLAACLPVVRDWRPRGAGHTIAFVGQSGVGKSSAAASLAGRHRAAGLTVALVSAGTGPYDALTAHAHRLDVQLFRAQDGGSLATLRATLADRDVVVIDTDGCSHQQPAELERLAALLGPSRPDEVHLVLPLATPPADLGDVQSGFAPAGVNRLTITKVDETRFGGNLMNVPMRTGNPLGFLSDGAAVPGSLVPADARRIAQMLLP